MQNLFYDIVYAFVIKDVKNSGITEEFLKDFVNSKVNEQKKITGDIIFVDKFPTTVTGKVLNRELKKLAEEIHRNKIRF